MKILELQQVNSHFGQQQVLKDLNLSLNENEIVCLLGASGCGKTTLLKTIAGLQPISSGTILLAAQDLANIAIEKRKIGLIFQDYALFPHLTVTENIQFGLQHLSKAEQQHITQKMLAVVKLQGLEQRFPHELSGGQQQRVAIARALACQPRLLLLDEPFSNIDTQTRYEMISEIKHILKNQNVPAIFVTHSKEEAFAFADKIAVMDQGKIVQFDEAASLYQRPINPFVADFLGNSNYLACRIEEHQLHQLHSSLGVFPIHESYPAGNYRWLIRPEQLRISLDSAGNGKIVDKLFLGQHYRYQIALQQTRLLAYHLEDFAIGQSVKIELHASYQQNKILFPG